VAIGATDIVTPVLATAEVVVLFSAGVTSQTGLGDLFRRLVLERNDLLRIALFAVCLAGTVARLAAGHLVFPTADFYELGVRRVREIFELIFVTIFASLATYILIACFLRCG